MSAKWMVNLVVAVSVASPLTAGFAVGADAPPSEASIQGLADRVIEGCLEFAADKRLPPLSLTAVDEGGAPISFKR